MALDMTPILLPYGKSHLSAGLSGFSGVHVLEQKEYTPVFSEVDEVANALKNPIGEKPLQELAAGKKKVLLITNDMTRPMPSKITINNISMLHDRAIREKVAAYVENIKKMGQKSLVI